MKSYEAYKKLYEKKRGICLMMLLLPLATKWSITAQQILEVLKAVRDAMQQSKDEEAEGLVAALTGLYGGDTPPPVVMDDLLAILIRMSPTRSGIVHFTASIVDVMESFTIPTTLTYREFMLQVFQHAAKEKAMETAAIQELRKTLNGLGSSPDQTDQEPDTEDL